MENMECIEYIKQAFELKKQKYYKPAVEMLYKALEAENDNCEILFQISELHFLMNDLDRTSKYLEKVLQINPNHIESLKLLQEIKQQQGDLNSALDIVSKIYNQEQNCENLHLLVKVLLKLKLFLQIQQYKSCEHFDQNIKIDCAEVFYNSGEIELAQEFLSECSREDERVLLLSGKIKFDNEDYVEAQKIFNALSSNTQNPEILNYLGLFDLENMDFVEAIKNFSKACNMDNSNPKYFYNLGNSYFYNGWIKEAQKAYMQALYLNPENCDYRYSLAYLYYDTGEYSKAQQEIDTVLEKNSSHVGSQILKALLLAKNTNFIEAKDILEKIICAGCDDEFAKISLSKIYKELNKFDRAREIILQLVKQKPQNLDYLTELASICIKEKSYKEALQTGEKIIEINSNYISAYGLCAEAAYLLGDYELTKEYAQEAITLDINYAKGYYYLSLSRYKTGDCEEAIECMKRAILYDLNNPLYYARMSEYYQQKKDAKTALEYMSEAAGLDKTNEYKYMYSQLVQNQRKNN